MFIVFALLWTINLIGSDCIGCRVRFKQPVTDLSTMLPLVDPHTPASFKGDKNTCVRRAYQALFNEQATVTDFNEEQNAYQLRFDNLEYGYDENKKPRNTLWAPRSAVEILNPYAPGIDKYDIVLKAPWSHAGVLYSVGTRFRSCSHEDGIPHVYFYNQATDKCHIVPIEQGKAIAPAAYKNIPPSLCLLYAVHLLMEAAKPGVVPFGWGCASLREGRISKPEVSETSWNYQHNDGPYSGFDASSLVYRCAQMFNIYFPWKTTAAAFEDAPTLYKGQTVHPGYIICFPGFEAIIASDTTVYRMVGYDNGSGALEETPLQEIFAGIATIQDLQKSYTEGAALKIPTRSTIVTEWKIIPLFPIG